MSNGIQIGTLESKFADLIWEVEPVMSAELCKMAKATFDWHKSTTYTVLRRLCAKGIFKNEKSQVTAVISREDYYAARSMELVKESFGSLPAFIVAFAKENELGAEEVAALKSIVDKYERGE